eukprot:COSAG01_NODE_765_length_13738_cov_21.521870_7_plen_466_part_00
MRRATRSAPSCHSHKETVVVAAVIAAVGSKNIRWQGRVAGRGLRCGRASPGSLTRDNGNLRRMMPEAPRAARCCFKRRSAVKGRHVGLALAAALCTILLGDVAVRKHRPFHQRLTGSSGRCTDGNSRTHAPTLSPLRNRSTRGFVWVILAECPDYVVDSIRQARRWNPEAPLTVLTDTTFPHLPNVAVVATAHFDADPRVQALRQRFFVSGDMGLANHRSNFNLLTSLRLYYLHAWMYTTNATDMFHLENDNLVFFNAATWVRRTSVCRVRMATTCREMRLARRFMIPGIVYVHNAAALASVLDESLALLARGKTTTIQVLGTEWVNDMSLVAHFYWSRLPNRTEALAILPEGGVDGLSADDVDPDPLRTCLWDRGRLMFDNAALSIWYFGDFHQKTPRLKGHGAWGAYQRIPADTAGVELVWRGDKDAGLTYPTWRGARVGSLHVHSKTLRSVAALAPQFANSS